MDPAAQTKAVEAQKNDHNDARARRQSSLPLLRTTTTNTNNYQQNFTPPDTPTSPTDQSQQPLVPELLFHNYLRAFHPFEPSPDDEAAAITVPIKLGDLVLVHSIHANGWADGTLLNSGTRGWLPTNYCEAYDHPYMRNLLNAMTQFWDLIGDGENASFSTFVRQDYIRGLIAGVRYLLEHTGCLHRATPLVLQHVGVRRMRKGLLADLSSMVAKAKELQEEASQPYAGEVIHIVLDELISKAFKVITRAVKFLDIWTQETLNTAPVPRHEPPTPPVESDEISSQGEKEPLTPHSPRKSQPGSTQSILKKVEEVRPKSSGSIKSNHESRRKSMALRRSSASYHRLSLVKEDKKDGVLASEQLAYAHDECISLMGQFLGHHMQSRSPAELFQNTQRLVAACRRLITIMDQVRPRATGRVVSMHQSQLVFQTELDDLVKATREVFTFSDNPDDEVVMLPGQISTLVANGTRLIRAVGECVANTRRLLEKGGDFDIVLSSEPDTVPPPLPKDHNDVTVEQNTLKSKALPPPPISRHRSATGTYSIDTEASFKSIGSPVAITPDTPGLPDARISVPQAIQYHRPLSRSPVIPTTMDTTKAVNVAADTVTGAVRKDSVSASVAETSTTTSNVRDSKITVVSGDSTRATTPDRAANNDDLKGPDPKLLASFGSISSLNSGGSEGSADADGSLLHKTFAHEITFNQQGQITAGSLAALIEQLTAHDSTPDPTFANSFLLTFRLFTTSRQLATSLIERFDYIGDSKTIGVPVRLRICNFFKSWLEGFWNAELDKEALGDVRYFALHKVKPHWSTAADRLLEATRKITANYQTGLVSPSTLPRNMTFFATTDDSATPEPAVSKAQLAALRSANSNSGECNIIDMDPVEVARQLTVMASRIYCAIQPDELLSLAWNKKGSTKATNVKNLSRLNTEVNFLVNDTILSQEEAKKRAIVVKQWVKIAAHCLTLRNFESLYAIVASLMCSHIARMKKTWELVSKKTKIRFEELKAAIDGSNNEAALRRRVEEAMSPCIPFLGIYLKDLTFIDAGNPATRAIGNTSTISGEAPVLINFTKYAQMAKIVASIQRFQSPYSLQTVSELQVWLDNCLARMRESPDELEKSFLSRSYALEPRLTSTLNAHKAAESTKLPMLSIVEERPKTAGGEEKKMDQHGMKEQINFFVKHNAFGLKAALSKFETPTTPTQVLVTPTIVEDAVKPA